MIVLLHLGMFLTLLSCVYLKNKGKNIELPKIFINKGSTLKKYTSVKEMDGVLYSLSSDSTNSLLNYYRLPYSKHRVIHDSGCLMNEKNSCLLSSDQCLCLFPDFSVLGDKERFAELLYRVYPELKENEWYLPRTYLLFEQNDREEFLKEIERLYGPSIYNSRGQCNILHEKEILKNFTTCPIDRDVYVMKAGNLYEGIGMFSLDPFHIDDLFIELNDETTLETMVHSGKYIAQRYIGDLHLYNTRKCHSRKYFLILSVEPLYVISYPTINTFCGRKGYTVESGFTEQDILSTNLASHSDSGYVRDTQKIEGWFPDGFIQTTFREETNRIISHISKLFRHHVFSRDHIFERVVRHRYHQKTSEKKSAGFPHYSGLFRIDILVDKNLKIWITEVQTMGKLGPYDGDTFNLTEVNEGLDKMALELLTILLEFCEIAVLAEKNNIFEINVDDMKSIKNAEWVIKGGIDLF